MMPQRAAGLQRGGEREALEGQGLQRPSTVGRSGPFHARKRCPSAARPRPSDGGERRMSLVSSCLERTVRRFGLRALGEASMSLTRIQVDPAVCLGQPTIRGLRLTVSFVLRLIGSGMTEAQIVDAYPELEPEDVREAALYGAWLASDSTRQIPTA